MTKEEYEKKVVKAREYAKRQRERQLEKLNSDLLLLSKEDLNLGDNIEKFDLNDFIDEISEFYTDLAGIKNGSLLHI